MTYDKETYTQGDTHNEICTQGDVHAWRHGHKGTHTWGT